MIKSHIKCFALPRRINARLKSAQMERRYRRTLVHYADRPERGVSDVWRTRARRLQDVWRSGDLRIFFVGTDEQQDKSGFVQALERLADVRYFVRDDGAWGQNDPAAYADRRARNTLQLERLITEHAGTGWVPHLVIAQTWGCLLDPRTFSKLRTDHGVFVANIAMDDRHQYWGTKVNGMWDGTFSLIPHVDVHLTAAPEAVHWYRKEGAAAFFFPEASDPDLFHPMPELGKRYDACFVGARYGIRADIVDALRAHGVAVQAFGSGWDAGRIETEAVPALFAQSRIVLGVSAIGHSRNFVGLKLRDFDAPTSGSCYLTQYNPDLEQLYKVGQELMTYADVAECVTIAENLLVDEARLAAIGAAGRRRAVEAHTWDRRFRSFLEELPEHP